MLTGEQARAMLAKLITPKADVDNDVYLLAKDADEEGLYLDLLLAQRGLESAMGRLRAREESHEHQSIG